MSQHLKDLGGEENLLIKQKDRNWGNKMSRTVKDLPQFVDAGRKQRQRAVCYSQ